MKGTRLTGILQACYRKNISQQDKQQKVVLESTYKVPYKFERPLKDAFHMPMNRGMDETLLRIGHACSLLVESIKQGKSQDYVNGIADALALVFDLPASVILERSGV